MIYDTIGNHIKLYRANKENNYTSVDKFKSLACVHLYMVRVECLFKAPVASALSWPLVIRLVWSKCHNI